jgi:CheY-like chemotaxis protein
MEEKRKILLVDDNDALIEVLTIGLECRGYIVATATDGWEAMKIIFNNHCDVLLLDINMPRMDGITTVKALRKSDPYTHILLISGEADDFKIRQALQNGANGFLAKPFSMDALLGQLGKINFLQIGESKKTLREKKERLVLKNQGWRRKLARRLRSSGFKRNFVFGIIILITVSLMGYLVTLFTETQTTPKKKDVYMEKMDELIEAIRQDWGR